MQRQIFLKRQRRRFLEALLLAWLVTVVAAGEQVWRLSAAVQSLNADIRHFDTLVRHDQYDQYDQYPTPPTLAALLHTTRHDAQRVQAEAAPLLVLTRRLGWLPQYGPHLATLEPVLDTVSFLAIAADETYQAYAPLHMLLAPTFPPNPAMVASLPQARPHLERAEQAVMQATSAWAQVNPAALPASLRTQAEQINAALPLLTAVIHMGLAADELATALVPILAPDQPAAMSITLPDIVAHLNGDARPHLHTAHQHITLAVDAWEQLPAGRLPPGLASLVDTIEPALHEGRDSIETALILPALAGANAPHTFLVIAQNPDELRATGGFFSSAGLLTLHQGTLAHVTVDDSVAADKLNDYPYPTPPAPLRRYMGIHLWLFRDANWSPDFPTSARVARHLYAPGQSNPMTSVIAFDPVAFRLLLEATGPMVIDGQEVSAETVMTYMRAQYTDGIQKGDRDAFMEPFTSAFISTLQQDMNRPDLLRLARAFKRALDERHIQIVVNDPDIAPMLAQLGWDGAVRPGDADFLMVVDTNMGYNKASASLAETMTYTVDLRKPSAPLATLAVAHHHLLPGSGVCVHRGDYALSYEDMQVRCHWNYLRVLVPGNTRPITATGNPTPAEWLLTGVADDGQVTSYQSERGTRTFGTFLVVPFGETRTTRYHYALPASVVSHDGQFWHYRLRLQKQAGREQQTYRVRLLLPEGATVVSASHPQAGGSGQGPVFSVDLVRDLTLDVVFTSSQARRV